MWEDMRWNSFWLPFLMVVLLTVTGTTSWVLFPRLLLSNPSSATLSNRRSGLYKPESVGSSAIIPEIHFPIFSQNPIEIDIEEDLEDYGEDDEAIDISSLTNHTEVAELLREFVGSWLDMKHGVGCPLHKSMTELIVQYYIQLRSKNINQLDQVALAIGNRLAKTFPRAEEEASICVWDIAFNIYEAIKIFGENNLATPRKQEDVNSTFASSVGECVVISNEEMEEVMDYYSPLLERYRLLRDFFDDLVPWKTIQIFVALGMGFRPDSESQTVCQVDVYTPPTWKKMGVLPNIQIDQDILLKMEHELPNSEDAEDDPMDAVLDTILGSEKYKSLKESPDLIIQRKLTIAKWIFQTGMLVNQHFPPSTTFPSLGSEDKILPCAD